MSIISLIFRHYAKKGGREAEKSLKEPQNIEKIRNISYGNEGKWNLMDVYYPKGTEGKLPTIVNVHGGGYVYGTKEESRFYCMDLATRGFTVVNFSYRLAPKAKFPSPLAETNEVMKKIAKNPEYFHIDLGNLFMTGDSAGAQIASQYCALLTSPDYAKLFGFDMAEVKIKAAAFNCGMYRDFYKLKPVQLMYDYFGKDEKRHGEKLDVWKYITPAFPPSFVMSAANDFLLAEARPFAEFLKSRGVETVCRIYGGKEQSEYCHVFHTNIASEEAKQCNDEECAFFRKFVR